MGIKLEVLAFIFRLIHGIWKGSEWLFDRYNAKVWEPAAKKRNAEMQRKLAE